jgi:hypothetical protein
MDLGGQDAHQGGLARSIGAKQGKDAGRPDSQIDSVQSVYFTVIDLGKLPYINCRCHIHLLDLSFTSFNLIYKFCDL